MPVGLVGEGAGERQSALLVMQTVGAVLCPESGVKAVRGFVGFAECEPFEAGQMAVGFVGNGLVAQNGRCGLW